MKIHEIAIKRPVATLMCVLVVLVLGFVSLTNLSVDLMPDIDFPIAIVMTTYQGVGPQEMESMVTSTIENAIATVSNVKTIQSQTSEGSSIVIAEFNSGTDMDFATLEMREKIDIVKRYMPDGVDTPMVLKMDPSMIPVAYLGITGGSDEAGLKSFIEDKIKPRFERLDGIASVNVTGGKTREIKVEVRPDKLSGYGVSMNAIISALQSENLNQPGGSVEYGDKSLLVRSTGEFKNIDQIKNIPIMLSTGNVIYIRDVADVKDGFKTVDSYVRMNGKNSIGLVIQKQTGSNTVKVVNSIKKEIGRMHSEYPDVSINLIFDQGEYIESSLSNVTNNAVVGALLAMLILFVFLKNFRTTFIIATAIPISIIGTFVLIYFSGITLNLVSMGGLALGVGMLVDNAIVVLENIFRFRQEGHSRLEAAKLGTQEVASAVIASTLTTVGVFLPIVFVQGIAAQIFKEMALTVSFSLLASLVVALTLIPMLASKFLKMAKPHEATRFKVLNRIFDRWDGIFKAVDNFYRKVLVWVLKHRKTTVISVVSIFIASMLLIPLVGAEFFPTMDQGQFTVDIELAQGALLDNTDQVTVQVERLLMDVPELERMFVSVGGGGEGGFGQGSSSNTASISATLKPLAKRTRSTAQVVDELREKVELIPGADIKITEVSSMMGGGSGGGSPILIKIKGPEFDKLEEISKEVEDIVKKVEGTRQVTSSISEGRPEAQIYVDRDKASYYGLGSAQVASAIRTAVDGSVATTYKVDGDEIDVRVQFPENERKTFEQLKSIKIAAPTGSEVPLSDIAEIRIEQGPVTITREGQERYVNVSSQVFGRDIGSISRDIQKGLKGLSLPSNYSIEFGGQQQEMVEAFSSLAMALLLAVVLVYMIMAAQFESLLHPFVIMFSVPLAYTGSALGLVITGRALSVPAFIGVIMLAGIVVNNAIVLVDYINTLRKSGLERNAAIIKAGPTRLRPILMTTLTTILGLIPLALGIGEGAEAEAPLATVVIGGLTTSTILTLVIIPVVYTIFDDIAAKAKRRRKAAAQADVGA